MEISEVKSDLIWQSEMKCLGLVKGCIMKNIKIDKKRRTWCTPNARNCEGIQDIVENSCQKMSREHPNYRSVVKRTLIDQRREGKAETELKA